MDYNRKEVIRENENLEEKNQEIRRMLAEITQLSTDHQKRAAELTRRMQEINISMEEVYRGNERAAQDIEKIGYDAGEVATYAEKLRELVAEINDNVDRFTEATANILGVARQTRILSLNAGIEAARSVNTVEVLTWWHKRSNDSRRNRRKQRKRPWRTRRPSRL